MKFTSWFLLALTLFACTDNSVLSDRSLNITLAQKFMDDLFVRGDMPAVRAAMHEDFTFTYMGNIEGVGGIEHTQESFFNNHVPLVGELLPEGIVLTTEYAIADNQGVALIMVGDSRGINGEYDNEYVFTFKINDGLILSIREYNSDLLVATRLYLNKLVEL